MLNWKQGHIDREEEHGERLASIHEKTTDNPGMFQEDKQVQAKALVSLKDNQISL